MGTVVLMNLANKSVTFVTDVNKTVKFKEFVGEIPVYFEPFADEVKFQVVAIIETESDPFIQTFDSSQEVTGKTLSMKNFFTMLEKMGADLLEILGTVPADELEADAERTLKIGLANMQRDVGLKFGSVAK